jgi:hypothetical protein
MERHRQNPGCTSCHACLDPLGLALEEFDAVGRRRPPNPSVAPVSVGNFTLATPQSLSDWLWQHHQDDFRLHLASSLLTYACGRPMGPADLPQIREIIRIARRHGDSLKGYLYGVIRSTPFQTKVHE